MGSTDVIIAGGGLMGLTSAYYLQRQGLSVRLFDSGPVAQQASWAGGGILWPLYAWRYPQPVQAMAAMGRRTYPGLCEALISETGIDPQYRESGLLILDADEKEKSIAWCQENQELHELSPLSGEQKKSDSQDSAVLLPRVAQVRNPRLCKALHASLKKRGAIIHEQEAVRHIVEKGGEFCGVKTEKGEYSAKIGVVATGAWASELLPQVELFPVKGQMLLMHGEPGLLDRILLRNGRYAIPRADGYILIGSTVEESGFDTSVDADVAALLKAEFSDFIPDFAELKQVQHWAGLRPATRSGVPFVDEIDGVKGLYLNAGHYRNGVVTAPASALLLAAMVAGEEPELDAGDFVL